MRRFLLISFLIFFNAFSVAACDVSLFAIIAGNSSNDAFSETVSTLVSYAKALANNSQNKEEMPSHMQRFMVKWIDFNTKYMMNPPDWAKKDLEWKSKFNQLTALIGNIRNNLVSIKPDQSKAHNDIQKFARQLTMLFDSLPMDNRSRSLLDITMHLDHIWDAWHGNNQLLLIKSTEILAASCNKFSGELDDSARKLFGDLLSRAEDLQALAKKDKVFESKSFEFALSMTENEFAKFNDAQKESALPPDK